MPAGGKQRACSAPAAAARMVAVRQPAPGMKRVFTSSTRVLTLRFFPLRIEIVR